jgi:hypothetical protein
VESDPPWKRSIKRHLRLLQIGQARRVFVERHPSNQESWARLEEGLTAVERDQLL